jgi:hypothetical protein
MGGQKQEAKVTDLPIEQPCFGDEAEIASARTT